ncbi:solute carrier family 28 member 3 isoform X1 [Bombus terrestris]|uniref:Sodium/nucleoside cotransporter n=1 Tax=Bombus terrestris TaxID=30195 RepID=A0A9B2JMZ5_BOMTE|nr:solute carrier family 28 member 3 isoform X1 [Bombus terrestris]
MSGTLNPDFESNEFNTFEIEHLTSEEMTRDVERAENSTGYLRAGHDALHNFYSKHQLLFRCLYLTILNAVVLIYLVSATLYWKKDNDENYFNWCDGYGLLIILLVITYGGLFYHYLGHLILGYCCRPFNDVVKNLNKTRYGSIIIQTVLYACFLIGIIVFLIIDTANSRERLRSGLGIIILLAIGYIFSKHPGRVKWRPVLSGLILQFLFGLLLIRWPLGRSIFQCLANKVEGFLNFAKSGASFIYSDKLVTDGVFAFSVLPVIFYFSFFIQIFYYLGTMQWFIFNLGRILQSVVGTSICESVTCAGNIFLGMTESPLMIKPYLNKLTTSELHTIMCSGFATVSGTVFAAYIKFGANPAHLITSTLMAAPGTLCYSKLFYPETEKIIVTSHNVKLEKSKDSSLVDAASKGAVAAIPLILGIIANIVAFVSFMALVNSLLSWIGSLVGYEELTLELILSKVFMPLSWIMGVPWDQCDDVATLIGLKTVVNEFVAYETLGKYKEQGRIFGRTEAIATFAICGFANPSSVGITMSMMNSLAPDKKESVASTVVRAFVGGSIICFITASIAGMLISDDYY